MKRNNVKKVAAVLLAVIMVVGCSIGATVAYLQMKTDSIKNTFTTSDVSITLTETLPADKANIKMVPGAEIKKDPTVTVLAGSEKCYLFVKVDDANTENYLEYDIAEGWTALTGETGVYYRTVNTSAGDQPFPVLVGNKVTVSTGVTKAMMETAKTAVPTMTFTAYAIQFDYLADKNTNGTVDQFDAWELITK